MAAQAWKVYDEAKDAIGSAGLDLSSQGLWQIALFKSTSNVATETLSLYSELISEVDNGNGYLTKGSTLAGITWLTGASAGEMRFDCTDPYWSCDTANITSIQFAVIYASTSAGGGPLLCYSSLSSSVFVVTPTNRLTLNISANGVLELN